MTKINESLALGRVFIDRDPLSVLQELRACMSYAPAFGYIVALGKDQQSYLYRRLVDCIAFNTGGDTVVNKYD